MDTNMELMHTFSREQSNEQILQVVLSEDELSWQHIIVDLVRKEQMDPWDIDVTLLTQKFLTIIRKLQQLDFRVGGKLVLAAAVLLKIKSDRLMDEDLSMLDSLIHSTEHDEELDLLGMDFEDFMEAGTPKPERPKIYPRTPQPRQRKVSVYDLVTALEQALEVTVRREKRALDNVLAPEVKVPEKQVDISGLMNILLERISSTEQETLYFHHLIESEEKQHKVLTFIPLLHLVNERRVNVDQPEHFGHISISLLSSEPVVYKEAL